MFKQILRKNTGLLMMVFFLAGIPCFATDWSNSECGVSFSYDETVWTVKPHDVMALWLSDSESDENNQLLSYHTVTISCGPATPGVTLGEKEIEIAKQNFLKLKGVITETQTGDFNGAPSFWIYGTKEAAGTALGVLTITIKLDGKVVVFSEFKSLKKDGTFDGYMSGVDLYSSVRFEGYAYVDPAVSWGSKGIYTLEPQTDWNFVQQSKGTIILQPAKFKGQVNISVFTDDDRLDLDRQLEILKSGENSPEMTDSRSGRMNLWGREVVFLDALYPGLNRKSRSIYTQVNGSSLLILLMQDLDGSDLENGFSAMGLVKKMTLAVEK